MYPEKPVYKTWIRKEAIIIFSVLTVFSVAGIFLSFVSLWFLFFIIPAFISAYILTVISLSSWYFSSGGGDFQNKIHNLILRFLKSSSKSRILDIGCGSGNLAVKIAKMYPGSKITGLDYWGENWEYSKTLCENNCRLEGLNGQVSFIKGTAAKLRFDDNTFDNVVSCLTFHEVSDVDDKSLCIKEALRVLKPSGCFVFFDLFSEPKYFYSPETVKYLIDVNGCRLKKFRKLSRFFRLPFPLNTRKVLGRSVLVAGVKEKKD
jgi:ubiquinone/menaquinone biosynthesis C-methylase UbiE